MVQAVLWEPRRRYSATYSIIRVAELLSEMYKMKVENINFFLKIGISTGKENGNEKGNKAFLHHSSSLQIEILYSFASIL